MKKVLLIEAGLDAGGGQMTFLALVEAFLIEGWDVSVVVSEASFVHTQLCKKNLRLFTVKSRQRGTGLLGRLLRNAAYFHALWNIRADYKTNDLLIVNDPDFFIPASFLGFALGLKNLILFAHLVYPTFFRFVFKRIYQMPSVCAVWYPSEFLKTHIGSGTSAVPIHRILAPPCRFSLRPAVPYESDWTFASIGLLHPDKGHDVIVMLARALPGHQFYIIGPDPLKETAYAQTLRAQAPSNVRFSGFVGNLPEYFDVHHIRGVVVASRNNNEAFGLVAIEAVALAQTCVVRDTGGLSEIAALLGVPLAKDDEELVSIMTSLLLKVDHQDDIVIQQERWKKHFSSDVFIEHLRNLSMEVLDIQTTRLTGI